MCEGADQKETSEESDSDSSTSFSDLLRLIQDSILIFRQFLKADKKKPASFLNVFGGHSQVSGSLHQIKTDLDKVLLILFAFSFTYSILAFTFFVYTIHDKNNWDEAVL